jgi:DNA-binding transcriptional regulator YiaG
MITQFPKRLTIARLIREQREDAGLIQKECAARVDYTVRQWQYWESGECKPTGRALRAIIRLFPNMKDFV